jgi:outer membrane protein OmpA-like peptidoglycan-associated protein
MQGYNHFLMGLLIVGICSMTASFDGLAQEEEQEVPASRLVKQADKMLQKGNIYAAADAYEKAFDKEQNMNTAYKLAEAHRYSRDYKNAEKWYSTVVDEAAGQFPMARYRYGLMLKMNAKYKKAKSAFSKFKSEYQGEDAYAYKRRAETQIDGCDFASKEEAISKNIDVEHLDKNVNSSYTEISPMMWDDSTLLFASLQSDTLITGKKMDVLSEHLIRFFTAKQEGESYTKAQPFNTFKGKGQHVANGAFSTEKDRFYFTKCKRNDDSKIICSIYMSRKENGEWQEPVKLNDDINKEGYSNTQPAIAPYRNGREILYFVSNRPDGEGGKDIWYSVIDENGEDYRRPRNAGSSINTKGDEATPFFHEPSNTFYFSSNGQMTMGGYDIYKAKGSKNRWNNVANMGKPLNSSTDDMYFRLSSTSGTGFMVSNRPGIFSIRSETCCDDIFSFRYYDKMRFAVKGNVYEEGEQDKPLDNAVVELEQVTNKDQTAQSDSALANKPYLLPISMNQKYKLTASRNGYLASSQTVSIEEAMRSDTITKDFYLTRKVTNQAYKLENIYYDYDKWDLRKQSKKTLDTLYQILVDNPDIAIELRSHTDSRGADDYNKKLSQKRAESCVDYLIQKGIDKNRLVAEGYGESKPLIEGCTQKEECPEEGGKGDCPCYQKNRRTEFTILDETEAKVSDQDQKAEESQ